jgi:hypothetical protein
MFAITLSAFSFAEDRIIEIQSATIIQNPGQDEMRILVKPDLGLSDTSSQVIFAKLNITAVPQTQDTTFISIKLHAILTDWQPNTVTWDSPWMSSGGDFDSVFYAEQTIVLPIENEIEFDLTDLVHRWSDGRLPYYGFLFRISEVSGHNFTFVRRPNNGPLATITISYMPTYD